MTGWLTVLACAAAASAQTADQVLVVINNRSADSREIGAYYMAKRRVPASNLCTINATPDEAIDRAVYEKSVEAPVSACLTKGKLVEKILYIVTTIGVPLRITGDISRQLRNPGASVDSELTLLYAKIHGSKYEPEGPIPNPFFRQRDAPFRHPLFPIYLVTRLAAYNMSEMKGLVDKALVAKNTGVYVIDLRKEDDTGGNQWLRAAALLLPKDRVLLDETAKVVTGVRNVIGFASWGSNDHDRTQRFLHMQWLPGAIATEYVSTNARSFHQPPDKWQIGSWNDTSTYFEGSPQTMTADYIHEGASGVSGQVDEPYVTFCPRPDLVLPAYNSGRNLAESFYLGIPGLSWMNVVIGDPLMKLQ